MALGPLGKRILYIFILILALTPGSPAGTSIDLQRQKCRRMLEIVSYHIEKEYYDPKLEGLDWKALVAATKEKINHANSYGEMILAIFQLVEHLRDAHTRFVPPPWQERFYFGFQAKPFGDEIRIWDVKHKGAAEKAGLQPGDQILLLNGFRAERKSWEHLIAYLRLYAPRPDLEILYARNGDIQKVQLTADREIGPAVMNTLDSGNINQMVRDFESPRTEASRREHEYRYSLTEEGIGYIELRDFDMSESIMTSLAHKVEKAKAVVVDLRDNGGGAVDTLAYMAGLFEAEPTSIANIVRRDKQEPVKVKSRTPNIQAPMYILVDSETGSAAEMFTYFFQRKGRAVVLGDHTSGAVKASKYFFDQVGAGEVSPYATQVAIGRVVFGDGEDIDKKGVTPDVECIPSEDDLRKQHDACLMQAGKLALRKLGKSAEPKDKKPN